MSYLILDIETVIDTQRLIRVEGSQPATVGQPGRPETREEMLQREMARICNQDPAVESGKRSCFMPVRYHAPAAVCMLLVDDHLNYVNHAAVAHQVVDPLFPKAPSPDFKRNTESFWGTYDYVRKHETNCKIVTFSGSNFDLPCLEITAMEYGIALPEWFVFSSHSYADPRSQYQVQFHLDLSSYLSKSRGGSLSYYSRLIGLPGKLDSNGAMVADMLKEVDGTAKVSTYCMLDCVNTYGVLFNLLAMMGTIPSGYRGNPIFESTMAKALAGLGPEADRFKQHYSQAALAATGVPF